MPESPLADALDHLIHDTQGFYDGEEYFLEEHIGRAARAAITEALTCAEGFTEVGSAEARRSLIMDSAMEAFVASLRAPPGD